MIQGSHGTKALHVLYTLLAFLLPPFGEKVSSGSLAGLGIV